jgi:hypothetical protein
MTSTPVRLTQPSPRQLLSRILEEPALAAAVQSLEPRALGGLIRHIGLEDAGELISLATTEQLKGVFDEDLWRSERPGQDESFDAERFTLWLEVMLEAGEAFVAERLSELPEDLLTLALHRHALVINVDQLAAEMSSRGEDEADLTDKALDGCLYFELDEHQLIARRHEGWDALISALVALDKDHHDLLARLLERCCYLSSEYIEENGGLYNVLSSEETLEADLAADREERRSREGFIAPSSAASFLALARATALVEVAPSRAEDPITRAYFRELARAAERPAAQAPSPIETSDADRLKRLVAALVEAEVMPEGRAPRLEAGVGGEADALFKGALLDLGGRDAALHARCVEELAYLANVLVAGSGLDGRAFRPLEAIEAVSATASLGLERLSALSPGAAAGDILGREGAVKAFRVGWRLLYELSLAACHALERALSRRAEGVGDRRVAALLERAAAVTRAAIKAGKPWTARARLEGSGGFDGPTLGALRALLDEGPALAGRLLEGEARGAAGGRSGGLRFIANEAQLALARELIDGL